MSEIHDFYQVSNFNNSRFFPLCHHHHRRRRCRHRYCHHCPYCRFCRHHLHRHCRTQMCPEVFSSTFILYFLIFIVSARLLLVFDQPFAVYANRIATNILPHIFFLLLLSLRVHFESSNYNSHTVQRFEYTTTTTGYYYNIPCSVALCSFFT